MRHSLKQEERPHQLQGGIWIQALVFFSRVSDEHEGGISAHRSEAPAAVMNCSQGQCTIDCGSSGWWMRIFHQDHFWPPPLPSSALIPRFPGRRTRLRKDRQLVTDHCWEVNSIYPTLQPFFRHTCKSSCSKQHPHSSFCSSRGPFLCLYRRIMEMPNAWMHWYLWWSRQTECLQVQIGFSASLCKCTRAAAVWTGEFPSCRQFKLPCLKDKKPQARDIFWWFFLFLYLNKEKLRMQEKPGLLLLRYDPNKPMKQPNPPIETLDGSSTLPLN